jgi:hypothetical protein
MANMTAHIGILKFTGAIVGGIWLLCLGMWKPVAVWALLFVVATGLLAYAFSPAVLLLFCANKCFDKDSKFCAQLLSFLSVFYSAVIMVLFVALTLRYFWEYGEAKIPLLLLGWSVATGPFDYMAIKELGVQGYSDSTPCVFFLAFGYLIAALGLFFHVFPFYLCIYILAICMVLSTVFKLVIKRCDDNLVGY